MKATSLATHHGITSASAPRVHSESADWSAVMGAVAMASANCVTFISLTPMARTSPDG